MADSHKRIWITGAAGRMGRAISTLANRKKNRMTTPSSSRIWSPSSTVTRTRLVFSAVGA